MAFLSRRQSFFLCLPSCSPFQICRRHCPDSLIAPPAPALHLELATRLLKESQSAPLALCPCRRFAFYVLALRGLKVAGSVLVLIASHPEPSNWQW
eukprot:4573534-Pleurochrysis_carterae.AAC.2